MRLLMKRARKLERAVSQSKEPFAQAAAAGTEIAIAWTRESSPLPDFYELAPGDRKVADIVVEREIGGTPSCRTTERVTRDPSDFGVVYDGELKRIGRVVAVKGGGRLIEWE